ncbi:MAG: hypothetical protein SGI90_13580 [Candidatus Eisenbacteria bacterium]|nr:hypothetical protein [Candidatus Eisenbacteria bacterium]
MIWMMILGIVVLITAFAAVTGIKPKGSQPLARTRLIGVARLVLLFAVILLAYLAYRARSGG